MIWKLEGKVWRYGDNIDTDVIIPARYLNTFDPKELAKHCMVDIEGEPHRMSRKATSWSAAATLAAARASMRRLPSRHRASRRHRRELRAHLLPQWHQHRPAAPPEIGEDVEKIKAGDQLCVDTATGTIEDLTTGDVFHAHPLPGFVQDIARAGGLINYIKGQKDWSTESTTFG